MKPRFRTLLSVYQRSTRGEVIKRFAKQSQRVLYGVTLDIPTDASDTATADMRY